MCEKAKPAMHALPVLPFRTCALLLRPACLRHGGDDHFLDDRVGGNLRGKDDGLRNVGGVLQVLLFWHGNILLDETVKEVRAHTAWNDGRYPDTIFATLDAEAATEADETPFGGMIGRSIGPGAGGCRRGDIEDVTGVMPPHNLHGGFCHDKWPAQVDINYFIPLLDSHFLHRKRMVNCRTVDNDIQASKLLINRLDCGDDIYSTAHVALEGHALYILLSKVPTDALNRLFVNIQARNRATSRGKCACGCLAEATTGTGD